MKTSTFEMINPDKIIGTIRPLLLMFLIFKILVSCEQKPGIVYEKGGQPVIESKLKIMVDIKRADLNLQGFPFMSASIGSFIANNSASYPFYNEINTILLKAGSTISNYRCVDALDLQGNTETNVYYNTVSQQETGRPHARTYFKITRIEPTLSLNKPYSVPEMNTRVPEAGKRVKVIPPEHGGTDVYYSLYLPEIIKKDAKYPVIVEYTGNYFPAANSTGEVKDAHLGYALAKELNAIWIVMPYLSEDGKESVIKWWGSEEKTIDYCLTNVRRVCEKYNGNAAETFIIGFSRGAIAVNYFGLHNDRIADTWLGLFAHDHYDGQQEWNTSWGSPLKKYREEAKERIMRLNGRATLISQQTWSMSNSPEAKDPIFVKVSRYITENNLDKYGELTLLPVNVKDIVPNEVNGHTDTWMNYDSVDADSVISWFQQVIKTKPGTYTIRGLVANKKGEPIKNALVETGLKGVDYKGIYNHFARSDKNGFYKIEGLSKGERVVMVKDIQQPAFILKSKTVGVNKNETVDFTIDQ